MGLAADTRLMKVDLPALGNPTMATSASSFSSSRSQALLAELALLGERRGAPAVRQEAGVAPAADPGSGCQPALAVTGQVGELRAVAVVEHNGAHRDGHLGVVAACSVAVVARAVRSVGGAAVRMVAKRQQRRHVAVGHQPHVAAGAAVAARRPATRHPGLAPERNAPRSPVARGDMQVALIDKPGHSSSLKRGPSDPDEAGTTRAPS